MKHDETVVLGLVLIVAAIGGVLLLMDANRPVQAEQVVEAPPVLEVQRPWPSSGMATALVRCRNECLAREDLEQDGIDYCLERCDTAYLV